MKTLLERRLQREVGTITKEDLEVFLKEYLSNMNKIPLGADTAFRAELVRWKTELGMSMDELNLMVERYNKVGGN